MLTKFFHNDLPRNYKSSFYEDKKLRAIKEIKDGPITNIKIDKNPHYKNPLGKHVSSLNFIALSDFHYYPYPDIDAAKDPTHHLLWAKVPYFFFQKIPAMLSGQKHTWCRVGEPKRNNLAVESWPKAIADNLTNKLSPNFLVVSLGDYAPDAAQHISFLRAIEKSQEIMQNISKVYKSHYEMFNKGKKDVNAKEFKASGNHEKDIRPWVKKDIVKPTSVFYKTVGQTFFLQEIKNGTKKAKKALLCIDTDLLDTYWHKNVKKNASSNLYKMIREYSQIQDQLIEDAKNLEEVVVMGHVPKTTIEIAKKLNVKKITVIVGDKHYPITNTSIDPWWVKVGIRQKHLFRKIRGSGNNMDMFQIGATSIGIGGIKLLTNPTVFSVAMSANSQTFVQPISLGKNFEKEMQNPS